MKRNVIKVYKEFCHPPFSVEGNRLIIASARLSMSDDLINYEQTINYDIISCI